MRIVDKNYDFYDYLQDHTDTLVFDRRNSSLLTKEQICRGLEINRHYKSRDDFGFGLLQCGPMFWLLKFFNFKHKKASDRIIDYSVEVVDNWKDYNKVNKLLDIKIITYNFYCFGAIDVQKLSKRFKNDIDVNNFKIIYDLNKETKIPLLKACGISKVINPLDIFCAIEEYFSIEKTKLETTEPNGLTNNMKIEMHGFNTKSSFRPKLKRK